MAGKISRTELSGPVAARADCRRSGEFACGVVRAWVDDSDWYPQSRLANRQAQISAVGNYESPVDVAASAFVTE